MSKLKKEDTNKNGKIGRLPAFSVVSDRVCAEYSEWVTFYHKHIRDARALFPAFQVLLYQPQYSCNPPAIIILMFSILQVISMTLSDSLIVR